jgi:Flp pilus assembly pilin Flp
MSKVRSFFTRLRTDEKGVALVEWVVMAALIGGVAVAVMIAFNTQMGTALTNLGKCISAPTATTCAAPS